MLLCVRALKEAFWAEMCRDSSLARLCSAALLALLLGRRARGSATPGHALVGSGAKPRPRPPLAERLVTGARYRFLERLPVFSHV